jgi:hypothetical protein
MLQIEILSTVLSAESFEFPQSILHKGMSFHRIICEKSKLSLDFRKACLDAE